MANKIFPSWVWNRKLPAPFDDPSINKKSTTFGSIHNKGSMQSTLHPAMLRALLNLAKLYNTHKNGGNLDGLGAMGVQNSTHCIAEMPDTNDNTQVVVYVKATGRILITVLDSSGTAIPTAYSMKTASDRSGSAIFFTLMNPSLWDKEFEEHFLKFAEAEEDGFSDLGEAVRHAYILCDNIYRRVEASDTLGSDGLPVSNLNTGNIPQITALNISQGTYNPTEVEMGIFKILKNGPAKKNSVAISSSGFEGKYKFSTRILSEDESRLVPTIEPWYQIPAEVDSICKHIKATTGGSVVMRNFMMRGGAGTGKTEAAKAIASGLGLPYTFVTCSANMELLDLLGQILPNFEGKTSGDSSMPTFMDIVMDPSTAYKKLTGKDYECSITEEDVYQELLTVMKSGGNEIGFQYSETPLVQAFRYGWCCEIQEVAVIQQPGVLVGLNAMLDRCGSILLPTGEIVNRHPDTVLIFTTNVDYEGCKGVNQSVLSRMDLIFDIEDLRIETMVQRAKSITGFGDDSVLEKMAAIVDAVAEKCRQSQITDGCCGMRELTAWILSYMVIGDLLESAKCTIISSASSDPESRKEIMESVIDPALGGFSA